MKTLIGASVILAVIVVGVIFIAILSANSEEDKIAEKLKNEKDRNEF